MSTSKHRVASKLLNQINEILNTKQTMKSTKQSNNVIFIKLQIKYYKDKLR